MEVKARAALEQVLSTYGVSLRKQAGGRYIAICPFHNEKTPSFIVYPDGGYHCFGCGEYGDVITIVSKMDGIPLLEAARQLAADYGISLYNHKLTHAEHNEMKTNQRIVKALNDWADWAFDVLCKCHGQMINEMEEYAPKNKDEFNQPHARFLAACHCRDYVDYLLDEIMYAEFDEKISFYKEYESVVNQFADYAR